jgi:hypothetical protein
VKDDLAPERILARIGDKANNAFQAELDFFEWRADNETAPFEQFMDRYLEYLIRADYYFDDYAKIRSEYPNLLGKLEAIVQPIRLEIFGTK